MKYSEHFSLTSCQSKVDKMDGREIEAVRLLEVAALHIIVVFYHSIPLKCAHVNGIVFPNV